MSNAEIKLTLKKLTAEIDAIADTRVADIQRTLLNLVEVLLAENESLKEIIQQLKDEVNRLKGEQGKPDFSKKETMSLFTFPIRDLNKLKDSNL